MAMIRRCSAKILNKFENTPGKRTAQIALSHDNLGEEICNVHGNYMYVEVEGLHGDQMETRKDHPGYGHRKGNCFVPETLVTMGDGSLKPISEISVGETVLSGSGVPRKVINVWNRHFDGNIKKLKVQGHPYPLKLTEDHEVYTFPKKKWYRESVKYRYPITAKTIDEIKFRLNTELNKKKVGLIEKGDKVSRVIFQNIEVTDEINDYELAWLLGIYCAEGCCSKNKGRNQDKKSWKETIFVISSEEDYIAKKIKSILKKHFDKNLNVYPLATSTEHDRVNTLRCCVNSKEVANFFKRHIYGDKAKQKSLSPEIMKMPPLWQLHFLSGLLDGDGCCAPDKFGRDVIKCISASEKLLLQVQMILDRNNIFSTLSVSSNNEGYGSLANEELFLYDLQICNGQVGKLVHGLRVKGEQYRDINKNDPVYWAGNKAIVTVTGNDEVEYYKGTVYDLEVDIDHNYCAGGVLVSNCNGDFFAWEDTLLSYQPKYAMHAFETWRGKDNLENHDEQIVLGDIPDVWPVMANKSINMLIRTDKSRAWSICESVRKGSVTDVSMGCIVTHSFCTVCANRAETEDEFCDHLKYYKGQFVSPDQLEEPKLRDKYRKGVWVAEDNRGVFGIECSWITVGDGADPDAKVVNLIAGSDAPKGKQFNNNKRANYSSIADRFHERTREREIRYASFK